MSTVTNRDKRLYNSDLAPTQDSKKNWGWFEIFNVWANDVQSLFGYTLAASLFIASGLNGWAVFLAILLAGFFIMWLVNLSGKPSVKLGIPCLTLGAPERFTNHIIKNPARSIAKNTAQPFRP